MIGRDHGADGLFGLGERFDERIAGDAADDRIDDEAKGCRNIAAQGQSFHFHVDAAVTLFKTSDGGDAQR